VEKFVLVVEDDLIIRSSIVQILTEEGYDAQGVSNGKEALDYLRHAKRLPCVIILDLMMPIMDGWQFRAQQINDPVLQKIPVVVVTADGNAQQKAKILNAQGWVKKPVEISTLLKAVEQLCA
jgi:CheY-like chemotaxis protein